MAQRKEPNGTWTYYGKLPKGKDGKVKYYKKRGFKTRREAKHEELRFLESLKSTSLKPQMTLNDVISEYRKDAPTSIKESTLKMYYRIERDMIVPFFGSALVSEITTLDIQRWINEIYINGINGKKYADESIKGILLHMSGLLTYALKNDWIIRNPCKAVVRPKNPNAKKIKKSSQDNYWELKDFQLFIEHVEDDYRREIYEFAFYSGLRLGEICALQYKHCNWCEGSVTVEQGLSSVTSKITSPKTGNSYRTIKLPNKVFNRIKVRHEYLKLLNGFTDDWFVFGEKKYVSNGTVRRWFNEDVKKCGIKTITFHGLRHSHASHLLSNPLLSEQLIAERLGHTVKTLRDTYSHVYEEHRTVLDEYVKDL